MAEQESSTGKQELTVTDVLQILGLKEVELQYERARAVRSAKVIADLRAELQKLEKGH